ncbi:hypothetical protein K438DRAFT_1832513 [Mycena galopus ATCC 62051]|nr:hypothetical protein K438DRAFT_1832513 [Mycena galopus ATCC 62051]
MCHLLRHTKSGTEVTPSLNYTATTHLQTSSGGCGTQARGMWSRHDLPARWYRPRETRAPSHWCSNE